MLDVCELGYYVDKYIRENCSYHTQIKLHKIMFLMHQEWLQFVIANEKSEERLDLEPTLYDATFIAGALGPIVRDLQLEELSENPDLFKDKDNLRLFVNDVLKDAVDISEFKLSWHTQLNPAWKKNYIDDGKKHVIPLDDLVWGAKMMLSERKEK